ncbi:hypothetical protein [Polymorphobacter sp.]|uniref:hypothetical protein n=1 Tax=Polymorphobacter sp. TaxID=1909290 RepID=UPI003F6F3A8C
MDHTAPAAGWFDVRRDEPMLETRLVKAIGQIERAGGASDALASAETVLTPGDAGDEALAQNANCSVSAHKK